MSSLFALRALLFAGECLAGSVAILGLAWGLSLCVKRASLRHLVWLTAFAALTALPIAALIVPPQFVLQRAAAVQEKLAITIEPEVAAPAPQADIVQTQAAAPEPTPAPAVMEKSAFDLDDAALLVFTLWMAGVLWAAGRLALGAFGLAALRHASRPHTLAPENLPCTGDRRECELRLSTSGHGPMTFGLFKPVVLLPKDSLGWPSARLKAVLLHELAHVRRRDSLTQSLALIAAALYWPNPLVWIAARALRREAEIAADDAVIVAGIRPSAYAGELVQLASEFRGRLATSGVSMAGSALEARVKSALAPDQMRTGVTVMDVLKIACLGVAATAALAFLRPEIVDAQDAPPAPPAVVSASDLPPPPPPPPAPAVPASEAVPPAPPAPPAPDVQVRVTRHGNDVRVERTVHVMHVDKAEMAHARDEAHRAMAELDRVRPEIDKALDEAKIDAKVAKALKDVEPRVRAEIDRAMAQAKPEIRKALAEAHISEKVAKALADARPKIDAAIAEAAKASRRMRIEMHDEGDVHAKVDEDKNDDAGDESNEDEQK